MNKNNIKNLKIRQGSTFEDVVRWETTPVVFKAITGITNGAPAVVTAVGHGLTDGWRTGIESVKGMTDINSESDCDDDMYVVTVIDADTISLNDVNSADFKAYTSGGYLRFYTPSDLSGFTSRMSIKDRIGGNELLRLDTTNGRITVDNTAKTISRFIDAADTAAITWSRGVYDHEMVSPAGIVTAIASGNISVEKEVTTT